MMHRAWSSIVEVPYCFSRSSVKFQGHTALKIVKFDPNWAFPDSNSSLNSPMAMKCCTKLETAKERCPIVFQGHPSNFKVTQDKTSPILTQIGHFWTIGRSQLSNPSDLPCYGHHWGCLNFGLCAAGWAHFMCHHKLWPTSASHPFSFLNSSLGLAEGKHYQKITIPIFRLVLQNFAIPSYFPSILFYCYLFSLLSSGWVVIAVCDSISVQETS